VSMLPKMAAIYIIRKMGPVSTALICAELYDITIKKCTNQLNNCKKAVH